MTNSREQLDKRVKKNKDKLVERANQNKNVFGTGRLTVGDLSLLVEAVKAEVEDVTESRETVKQALVEYLKTPEGKADIEEGPAWLKEKSPEEIAELLLASLYVPKV